MKIGTVTFLSAVCLLGLVIADNYGSSNSLYGGGYGGYGAYSYYPAYGYGGFGGAPVGGGVGNGSFFALIGLLFIILLLFSGVFNFTSTSSTPTVTTVG